LLTIDDVLSIRHPEPPRWSPDGAWLSYHYVVDGTPELWAVPKDGGAAVRLSSPGQATGAWDWAPDGRLTWAAGKSVLAARPGDEPAALLEGQEPVAALAWAPDGRRLAVLRGGKLTLLGTGPAPMLQELAPPGAAYQFRWSPDSARIACLILEGKQRDAAVLEAATGKLLWRSNTPDWEHGLSWLGSDRLSLVRLSLDSIRREYVLVGLADGTEEVLERETSHRGLKTEITPVASPTGDAIAYTLLVDGWSHVVVRDFARGTRTVALPGAHEDVGHAGDQPRFSPCGRYVAFSSNKEALQQRHIWRYDRESGKALQLTTEAGTQVNPEWAPDGAGIAFIACSPRQSAEVAVVASVGGDVRRLTRSMPEAWNREEIVLPQHVTFPSAEGLEVHADLFLPQGFDPSRKYPALVYIHGGPPRQMRYGWHPMHGYAFFYSVNQYLLQKDYVIISVDYRGGIGYGVEYEQASYLKYAQTELEDCVNGGRYVKGLPYVDPERVAIWGLSYGGYMTLAALAKHPDEFALGVNLAGVWDFEQWARWIEKMGPGLPNYFMARWGGPKCEQNAEVYRHASPKNFVAGLKAPLLNLHGTVDEAVDFAQLDEIVKDCTEHGKDFAAVYYPEETHLFHKRKTWEDALRRIESAFERYLKCDPDRRPSAMM
jgi:dipeptidyl aminopeptidase/acylaminoacyl peptidase